MNVALIGSGALPIPPLGWGAVEIIIAQLKSGLECLGHQVDVYNTRNLSDVIGAINRSNYDFVHCHSELLATGLNAGLLSPHVLTTHYGGLFSFDAAVSGYQAFESLFKATLVTPGNLVLSERIARLYIRRGYKGFLRVVPNGVDVPRFRLASCGNGRAICVGRLCRRKRQVWLADVAKGELSLDFVGPRGDSVELQESRNVCYLGEWTRAEIYARLTDYSCLVLLSESEAAAPLVVLEALAAGVSVVVSAACADNLSEEEFITILPAREETRQNIVAAVRCGIDNNDRWRLAIRQYAMDRYDLRLTVSRYLQVVEEFRAFVRQRAAVSDSSGPLIRQK